MFICFCFSCRALNENRVTVPAFHFFHLICSLGEFGSLFLDTTTSATRTVLPRRTNGCSASEVKLSLFFSDFQLLLDGQYAQPEAQKSDILFALFRGETRHCAWYHYQTRLSARYHYQTRKESTAMSSGRVGIKPVKLCPPLQSSCAKHRPVNVC